MNRDREQSIEHGRRYCAHHSGDAVLHGGLCKAGVDPKTVAPFYKDRPCIDGHLKAERAARCPKWERVSIERATQEADEMQAATDRFLKALPVISQWKLKKPPEKDRYGEVVCPCCAGTLRLYQSAYNGHAHAKCGTPNCIHLME